MRALEDRAGADSELAAAVAASVIAHALAGAGGDVLVGTAERAGRLTVPTSRFEVEPGSLGVRDHLEEFECADCHITVAHGRLPCLQVDTSLPCRGSQVYSSQLKRGSRSRSKVCSLRQPRARSGMTRQYSKDGQMPSLSSLSQRSRIALLGAALLEDSRRHPEDALRFALAHRWIDGLPIAIPPVFEELYRDSHSFIVVQKPAQIGGTEFAMNRCI